MPPQHIHCIYKSLTSPPQRTTHFSLLFFPLLSASPGALPSYQDAALSDDYPFPVWRRSDWWSSEWLIDWDIETLLLLLHWKLIYPHQPLMLCCCLCLKLWALSCVACQLISDFWVFGCCFRPCHPIWASLWWLLDAQLPCYGLLSQKSYDFFLSQAPNSLHRKGNFLVILHAGLAVNCMVSLPLYSHLSTPPGSICLCILAMFISQWWNYCILFNSVCLTCEVWRCNAQMWLVQGTGSWPPSITTRWK